MRSKKVLCVVHKNDNTSTELQNIGNSMCVSPECALRNFIASPFIDHRPLAIAVPANANTKYN